MPPEEGGKHRCTRVKTKAETGGFRLQANAQDWWQPLEGREDLCPEPSEAARPCQHRDLRLLASRRVREQISVKSFGPVALCHSSHRTLIHYFSVPLTRALAEAASSRLAPNVPPSRRRVAADTEEAALARPPPISCCAANPNRPGTSAGPTAKGLGTPALHHFRQSLLKCHRPMRPPSPPT